MSEAELMKLKHELLQAAIVYLAVGFLSIRFGESSWAAYFMRCSGMLGTCGIALGLLLTERSK
jgi:hypothetical protein